MPQAGWRDGWTDEGMDGGRGDGQMDEGTGATVTVAHFSR